ncbi:RecX family transcriptional regulator, partial [Klebsiella pneumoniae]|uniref:RecX family transcriptional regulator n=1 Tax=Klebsiella pneumoniae TaxID=573 RepID=UPI00210EBB3E
MLDADPVITTATDVNELSALDTLAFQLNAPDELEQVVAWCIENRYLDDNRFVGQFIASRSRKGYGPARIRQPARRADGVGVHRLTRLPADALPAD